MFQIKMKFKIIILKRGGIYTNPLKLYPEKEKHESIPQKLEMMERIKMLKKLILVLITSILFITGCQNIKSVNLNQMILNNSKVKSSESKMTATLDLTYNRTKVQDKDILKVLDLLNHAKFEFQAKMQNSNTLSLAGNLILQQGKIPFKLYMDSKAMVLSLDNATKPIRIPMADNATPDQKFIQEIQTQILSPVVKNLPNPKHISVTSKSDKVHGVKVSGYNVHAEIYASEAPNLILTFINNLLKDSKSISQIVTAVNDINKATGDNTKITASEFKNGLTEIKTEITHSLPDLKKTKVLTSKNNFKTNIFIDRNFYERKSSSVLNIGYIPDSVGLTGIRLQVLSENWNLNKLVKAQKISYSKYLTENASPEQLLSTLDKKRSVLYSVITSVIYNQSGALKSTQVYVVNNKRKADLVTVKGIAKGDIVKVYKAKTGGELWSAQQATGPNVSMSISQLGKKSGKVYVSIMRFNRAESSRMAIAFKGE
jgi:hypothetical protein